MKNKNWIGKISNTYIQLNEEEEIQLQQKPTPMKVGEKVGELTFASIFDENLWQNLVAGMNKQQPTTPTTTTTRGRRVATGGASSTT